MKQQRSMDEALLAAKKLRREQENKTQEEKSSDSEAHLKVVEGSPPDSSREETPASTHSMQHAASTPTHDHLRPVWVRHTVGLRDTTSLSLRDAADAQKRKLRHRQLGPGEPANEQEIADLGVTLALRQLGYLP